VADYRLSVNVISRGKGQSSVASAAYRSASRLVDERTGEIHDYTRKQGVLHSEVMVPENTPEWMQDRQQLWSAVEAVETRKNSQLAREIQLSLPHELGLEQRKALVQDFVQEQFVERGMIADIAIHAPDKDGDERNHHAHIMLTMRELTGEGFHPKKATEKARSWNDDDTLAGWREQWAHHQNRTLELYGHAARVDHRSFEAQGVDREPQQHLGPVASDMERNGKRSRIGDENRDIANDNKLRAQWYAAEFELEKEIDRRANKFENWVERKGNEIEAAQDLRKLDLDRKHQIQKGQLEKHLKQTYGTAKKTIKAELAGIDQKLQAKGVRKILRNVFGQTRTDKETRRDMTATLRSIEAREKEQRAALEKRQTLDRKAQAKRQEIRRERSERNFDLRRKQLKAKMYLDRDKTIEADPKFQKKAHPAKARHGKGLKDQPRPDLESTKPLKPKFEPRAQGKEIPAPTPTKDLKRDPVPSPAPSPFGKSTHSRAKPPAPVTETNKPSLADLKTAPSEKPELGQHGSLSRPWESNVFGNDNKRPWESDLFNDKGKSRERGPAPSPEGGKGGGKDGD